MEIKSRGYQFTKIPAALFKVRMLFLGNSFTVENIVM